MRQWMWLWIDSVWRASFGSLPLFCLLYVFHYLLPLTLTRKISPQGKQRLPTLVILLWIAVFVTTLLPHLHRLLRDVILR